MFKARVLVVDDDQSMSTTLEYFLTEEGCSVKTADDYNEAILALGRDTFDLIIIDIILEGKSGIEILREINKRDLNCPVVMITGAPDIETATDALRLGAFDYIYKPIKKEGLLHVAGMALKNKALYDEKEKYRLHLETIFSNINEGIMTIDSEGQIVEVNSAAEIICGITRNDLGREFASLPRLCDGKCVEILKETLQKGQPVEVYRHECRIKSKPGRIVNIASIPLSAAQSPFSGAILVIRDETRLEHLERDLRQREQFHNIIGKSDGIQKIYSLIEALANVSTTVLVTGESGTGKELVAEALHYKGNRRDKPLIKVNCSALQESLLESELFGHVRGSFTGALESRDGRFKKADGGTIFLDEIGDISEKIQIKLLRVLQNKEFERVGDSSPVKVDVRVVAATNQDLRDKVRCGKFRQDLYYRLKVVEVSLPSLRDNREDIPLLIEHFIKRFNNKLNKTIDTVSDEVLKVFMDYSWPGNVRELEHTIEYACIVCRQSIIAMDCLPEEFKESMEQQKPDKKRRDIESSEAILNALNKSGWNISKAARSLGLSRPTIYRKIKEIKTRDSTREV